MNLTIDEVENAHLVLKQKWDSEGECGSCGWHSLLYEHRVHNLDIIHALQYNDGLLHLPCNGDAEDSDMHRGINIQLKDTNMENFNQYEIMDRTHIILESIDDNILNHIGITKKQSKKVKKAMSLLEDVYQIAGNLVSNDNLQGA